MQTLTLILTIWKLNETKCNIDKEKKIRKQIGWINEDDMKIKWINPNTFFIVSFSLRLYIIRKKIALKLACVPAWARKL